MIIKVIDFEPKKKMILPLEKPSANNLSYIINSYIKEIQNQQIIWRTCYDKEVMCGILYPQLILIIIPGGN